MIGLALTAVVGVGVSAAASRPSPVVPGGATVAGRGYGQWVVALWKWRLPQPNITSNRTSCFTAGQHGPVWFLGGSTLEASVIRRTCAIPAGHYLMFTGPDVDCSTVEPAPYHATTDAGLMRCAKANWEHDPGWATMTLDGVHVEPAGYVGGTLAFALKMMPAQDNWLLAPGHTHARVAVYGSASILRPLTAGTHTLVLTSGFAHPAGSVQVTYQLTVG
jgi:hypothetical protein